ncbi:MAG: TetR/AcrR family transcriptional regulator [Acidimicrobiales bacterium]
MPRLWTDTVETHRQAVRDAVVDTTSALVARDGLLAVTMSRIAEASGIGRATLYKYFPDVESILLAWHERQIAGHLGRLAAVRDRPGTPGERLETVLSAYGVIVHQSQGHADGDLAALLHRSPHVARGEHHLHAMVSDLLGAAAADGAIRTDVPPRELASYCLHALAAAATLPSRAAVRRLVAVTLAGLCAGG